LFRNKIRTTGIANRMTTLVPSPQWSNGSSAVLTSHDHSCVLRLDAERSNVNGGRRICGLVVLRLGRRDLSILGHTEMRTLGDSVVECWASAASFGSTCTVAFSTSRARTDRCVIRSYVSSTG